MTTGKTTALTRRTFVGTVTCLLFNMLSRLVIAFLPRSKRLLISWLQSPSAVILELPKIKSVTVSTVSNQLPSSPDPESGVKEESTRGGHGKPPSSTPGLTAYLTAGPPRFRGFPRSGASAWEAAAPESRAPHLGPADAAPCPPPTAPRSSHLGRRRLLPGLQPVQAPAQRRRHLLQCPAAALHELAELLPQPPSLFHRGKLSLHGLHHQCPLPEELARLRATRAHARASGAGAGPLCHVTGTANRETAREVGRLRGLFRFFP